ncbi:MAG TPA: helix-turn-helix domain-containing protein [Sedimentisphaerales bacterium]|nr:helix-turn-helix domain-containing protein [Sedimentisphaerales bacterium]HRS12587.1 helix-turn-helix domain-containing protein [Sedimentisphaerales bacterium]HRV49225.1 helix-turn-helix domain-containing protein [Sedimentisphaerales bacterium]
MMEKPPDQPETKDQSGVAPLLLDAKAVATMLSISRATLYRMSNTGQLGPMPITLGRRKLWRHEEILAWVRAGCPPRGVWLTMAQDQGSDVRPAGDSEPCGLAGQGYGEGPWGSVSQEEQGLTATTLLCKSAHRYP